MNTTGDMTNGASPRSQPSPRPRLVHVVTVARSLNFLRGQARFMTHQGWDVHIVAAPDGDALPDFAAAEEATAHEIFMTRAMTPWTDVKSLWWLWRLLRRLTPDIVHAGTPKGGLLGIAAGFLNRVPVRIYHMHGIRGMTASGWRRRVLMTTERIACGMATRVLCVSESTRDTAIQLGLCDADKIVVLAKGSCNGVDARGQFDPAAVSGEQRARLRQELAIPAGALVLGFVGRVVREKGVDELAQAWQKLATIFPDLHLIIVGPVEEGDEVAPRTKQALQTHPRVRVVESVPDPAPYYGILDVVVLPTYREGLPNVALEAAAMGLPVVATAVPGCVDAIVDGVTGTLVPPARAQPLEQAIAAYLRSPQLRRLHGAAGRERVLREFVPQDLWDLLLALYRRESRAGSP